MSHITVLRTQLTNAEGLAKALEDMGMTPVKIIPGDKPRVVAGSLLQRALGLGLSFQQGRNGAYAAVLSGFGAERYQEAEWQRKLTQRYAYHVARAKLEAQGFTLVEEKVEAGDEIHLVLRRVA